MRNPRLVLLAATATLALSACATTKPLTLGARDSLPLGRNAAGDSCSTKRSFVDPVTLRPFDLSYSVTCTNVSAGRSVGLIRLVKKDGKARETIARIEESLRCGEPAAATVAGLGAVQARRCNDSALASEVVVLSAAVDGATMIGSAAPDVIGPLEEGMRRLAGLPAATAAAEPSIKLATLAAPPAASSGANRVEGAFDPVALLSQAVALNHRGLHSEASRLLNDALSRLTTESPPLIRAELSLEAALADSNIRFTQSADEHFARTDALIPSLAGDEQRLISRKRDTYKALDLLNRRQFRRALNALSQLISVRNEAQPLQDILVLRTLNQSQRGNRDLSQAVAVPDVATLSQLVIDAQANWARSMALQALGDTAGAERALADADAAFRPLSNERIDQAPIYWLSARLERQRGRLAARRGDAALAVASLDKAVDALTRGALGSGGRGTEPAIADLKLERAGIIAQQGGVSSAIVRAAFDEAVEALIASGSGAVVNPVSMESYLDLLARESASDPASQESFFRALQAVGEPAVARQMSKIQAVVTATPAVAAKVRDRAELEREITRLRYVIADTDPKATGLIADLDRQRQEAQDRLATINADLAGDVRLTQAQDRPVTLADIRTGLRPGEIFLKVAQLRNQAYGVMVGGDRTDIYRIDAPSTVLAGIADKVRGSIDGRLKSERKLVPFDVANSHALFRLVTGPASERLTKASAVILDPGGPLERIPAGVLVATRESVDRFVAASNAGNRWDYSQVDFLATRMAVSTAVSPRSFLIARSLPPSRAQNPFIGFAEHVVPEAATRDIDVGKVCSVSLEQLRLLSASANPISRAEVELAAQSFGVPASKLVSGAAFSDTAIRSMSDLGNYAVLHFATHGLEEGVWGCPKSPPALVTSFGDLNSDGLLSFDEIAELRLDANLVVLSACDTSSGIKSEALARLAGQEESGSTLQGLVRAFLTAGARSILATHWEVPATEGTPELIQTFYSTARTQDIGTSLQAAQRRLVTNPETSHPFYWGAYFLVGDASKSALSKPIPPLQTAMRK